MIDVDVRSNAAQVAVRYDKAPKLIATSIVKVLRRIGAGLQRHVMREKLQGQVLQRRTGTLIRSIFYTIFLDRGAQDAVLVLGADIKKAAYARILELGGVIVPVRAQNLAIPLDVARTAKGVPRMSAREFIGNPQGLGFDRAFVNKKRTAIMGARGGEAVPVFALKKRVVIKPFRYLRSTVQDKRDWILDELGAGVGDVVQQGLDL